MSGTFFDYQPGRIDTRFSHDSQFDYINLDILMVEDTVTTTDCDDEFRPAEPVNHQKEDAEFQVYMSSVFCPFGDFIRFLEAITIEVQECSFSWDSEGPDGTMLWERRYVRDDGFLTIEWHSSEEQFSHGLMLNTRQAVRALYTAFRTFVESADYDPLRYEQLTIGESLALVLSNASLDELTGAIARLDAEAAEAVMVRFKDALEKRSREGGNQRFPIAYFLEGAETVLPLSEFYEPWVHPEWDSWDLGQRVNDLKELFRSGSSSWYGANLRELRSKLIEDWLALPEPPLPQIRVPTDHKMKPAFTKRVV